jgi:GTPase
MIAPENEDGNIEYKRYIIPDSEERFQQLLTQLKWRVDEGAGIAYYLIGVEDNGEIFKLSGKQIKISMSNLKKLANNANCNIESIDKIKIKKSIYFKVKIQNKDLCKKFKERKILFLGKTGIGKTTFLSYIINNKLSDNSRMFILNHKHELESGKSSSFNYQYYIYNNIKYIFFDTPGDEMYTKTLNRILSSLKLDAIIYFISNDWKRKELYKRYSEINNINWIELDLHYKNNFHINMLNPPDQNIILDKIESKIIEYEKNKKNFDFILDNNFLILQTFPHPDLGWTLSGFLQNGTIEVGDNLYIYNKFKNNVTVKSIHIDNVLVKKIKGPIIATICLDKLIDINIKPKYGFLSSINYQKVNTIRIRWLYGNENLSERINGCIDNNFVSLEKVGIVNENKVDFIYLILMANTNYNFKNKIFISDKLIGLVIN